MPQDLRALLGLHRRPARRRQDRRRVQRRRFRSSEKAQRGFCSTCGASLFWDPIDKGTIAIAIGAFDSPTGTKIEKHIFVADKGDYYEIKDGLPQNAQ